MTGKPRRSDPTRAAILAAGRKHFSERGFGAATVRAIAAEANADPALVIRYFGSKQGLYDATTAVDLRLPDFTKVPKSRLGIAMISEFLERWEGRTGEPLRVLLASVAADPRSATQLRSIFSYQVQPALSAAASDQPERRVALVTTTTMGLAMTRYVLRLPPVVDLAPEEVIALYGPVVQRHLTGPIARPRGLALTTDVASPVASDQSITRKD